MSPSRSSNFTRNLKQTATYWGNPVSDGYGGRNFDAPVEIDVRWEDKQELFTDTSGQEKLSRAVVFVGEDVQVGGYLFLGSSSAGNPLDVSGAYEIKQFSKIPDLKAENFLRKIWL